jgi:hypothetical protein
VWSAAPALFDDAADLAEDVLSGLALCDFVGRLLQRLFALFLLLIRFRLRPHHQ